MTEVVIGKWSFTDGFEIRDNAT